MKRATFRIDTARGGFLRTRLAPVNERDTPKFCLIDAVLLIALVLGAVAVARLLLAN